MIKSNSHEALRAFVRDFNNLNELLQVLEMHQRDPWATSFRNHNSHMCTLTKDYATHALLSIPLRRDDDDSLGVDKSIGAWHD
jgi:hypothetical protein